MPVLGWQRTGPEPKRMKTTHVARSQSQVQRSPLTIQAFPHLLDAVIDDASPEALRALRGTCRDIRDNIDRRFSTPTHISLRVDPHNRTTADRPGAICAQNAETGLRVKEPLSVQVLDMNADVNALYYRHNIPYEAGADEYCAHWVWQQPDNETCLESNATWFDMTAPLARYTPSRHPDPHRGRGSLRYDALSVYFCNVVSFVDGIKKLDHRCRVEGSGWDGVKPNTIFNVSLAPEDNPPGPWWTSTPVMCCNQFTVLFTSPDFEETARQMPPEFMLNTLNTFIENFFELNRPRACVVGCERMSVGMFPRPNNETYWSDVSNQEGPMKDFTDTAQNRLEFWINHRIWLYEQMQPEDIDALGVDAAALHMNWPIKLLTLDEWREEIGDTYFELMTNPQAIYRSKEPLPPFKSQMDE